MKTHIAPRLKKALLASMSILALSLTCSPALADGKNYDGKNVDGDRFTKQSLIDSSWVVASAVGTFFDEADLTRANFKNSNLTRAVFTEANLTDAVLEGATIQGANFARIVGNDINAEPYHTVTHAMLKSTKSWKDNDLSGVYFTDGDLSGLNFTNFNLSGTSFWNANLSGAVLANANIQGVDLSGIVGNDINANPDHTVTHDMLKSTKSWKDNDLSGVNFTTCDLSGLNFTNFNLSGTGFTQTNLYAATFSGADLRGAYMSGVRNFHANVHNNLINTDGKILNLTLSSATDSLTIRGGTSINANLDGTVATISGGATLTLTENAVLELTNNTQLTLADDGNLKLILDAADTSSLTSIVIKSGSSLNLDSGAILDITIENFVGNEMELNILSWENDADVAELLAQLNDGASLRINDQLGYTGTIDYATKTFSVSYIPEPSTATLSLLALAGLLARRRRKAA